MHIIRPIRQQDSEAFQQLALKASTGILTLPRNPERLQQKVVDSLKSFASQATSFDSGKYLFVLEDLENHHIEGCSAIQATAGIPGEEYYYKIETIKSPHRPIESIPAEHRLLVPSLMPVENASEVCTLFVSPVYQKAGIGKLLSLGRYLFIANHRERFKQRMMVEVRGVSDEAGISPFWEHVGRHFCDVDFEEFLALVESKKLSTQDVLPTHPIYYSLLPPSVQDVVGKAHAQSIPALKMLQKEGFDFFDGVDISDAGPKLYAEVNHIRSVKTAQKSKITAIRPHACDQETLRPQFASNLSIDFRACYAEVYPDSEAGVTLDAEAAKALQVTIGDSICYINVKST